MQRLVETNSYSSSFSRAQRKDGGTGAVYILLKMKEKALNRARLEAHLLTLISKCINELSFKIFGQFFRKYLINCLWVCFSLTDFMT